MKEKKDRAVYSVAVIDDNRLAVEALRDRLESYPEFEVTICASNAADGLKAIAANPPDLLFLDFDLPDEDGYEVMRRIKSVAALENTYVVIYTAYYDRCGRQGAFIEGEQDYLLKPIEANALDLTLQRFLFSRRDRVTSGTMRPAGFAAEPDPLMVVMTAATAEMRLIRMSDIGYFRHNSRRKVWEVALADNTVIQLKKSTNAADILKYSPKFVQTHQSFIVNLDYVMLIGKQRIGLYPPFEHDEALVGRTYLRALQNLFFNL